jgi:hypothetical protein
MLLEMTAFFEMTWSADVAAVGLPWPDVRSGFHVCLLDATEYTPTGAAQSELRWPMKPVRPDARHRFHTSGTSTAYAWELLHSSQKGLASATVLGKRTPAFEAPRELEWLGERWFPAEPELNRCLGGAAEAAPFQGPVAMHPVSALTSRTPPLQSLLRHSFCVRAYSEPRPRHRRLDWAYEAAALAAY